MGSGGDELDRVFEFGDGAEAVVGAGDEKRGRLEARKVGGSQLARLLRRMKRVGEQEKAVDETGTIGGEHGGLAASVGVSPEKDAAGDLMAHGCNCGCQAGAVAFSTAA